ncbi:unnamed protein product [Didymodactylos carnosus]|uniref:Uncharacterized protein n=1 Tax=Didymodactylos carnosus TaxID=1234261 RepID=A0A8S2DUY6_9BILA|nr:unnamed protein product [Didymodactylos carnosus]CAF3752901.1 unnamed protein product [Didymodactylos carnosus]
MVVMTSSSDDKLSPQQIGRAFVIQYYRLLHECPNLLHRFYSDTSTFMHEVDHDDEQNTGGNGDIKIKKSILNKSNSDNNNSSSSSIVIGIDNIKQRIEELNFKNRHVKIRQVDCHSTILQGVVVQVCGEISSSNQEEQTKMKRFVQTFVLVPQSKIKYYVHNDIFRYQDPNQQDAVTVVLPATSTATSTVASANSTSLLPEDQDTYPVDYYSLIPPGFDASASASSPNFLFSITTATTDSSLGTTKPVKKQEIVGQPQQYSESTKLENRNNEQQRSYENFSNNDNGSWSQNQENDSEYFFAKEPEAQQQQEWSEFSQTTTKNILTPPPSGQTQQFPTGTIMNEKNQTEQQEKTSESSRVVSVKQQPKSYRDAVQPSSLPMTPVQQKSSLDVKNNQSATSTTKPPTKTSNNNTNTNNYYGSYKNNRMVNSYNEDFEYYPHGHTDDQEIFVGNLSFHATSDEVKIYFISETCLNNDGSMLSIVRQYFSTYGQIIGCRIGNTGSQPRSSNFAFVVCDTIETAKRILDDKENLQKTKKINVEAKKRRPFPHTFRPSYSTTYSYNQNHQYSQYPMQGSYDEQYNINGGGYYRNQNSRKSRSGRGGGGSGGNRNTTAAAVVAQTTPSV